MGFPPHDLAGRRWISPRSPGALWPGRSPHCWPGWRPGRVAAATPGNGGTLGVFGGFTMEIHGENGVEEQTSSNFFGFTAIYIDL